MSKFNIEKLTHKELIQLQQEVVVAIGQRRQQELTDLKRRVAEMADASGFEFAEVIGTGARGAAKRGPVVVKFRNPKNPAQTWTGRGRKPNWMVDAIKKGQKMETFAI